MTVASRLPVGPRALSAAAALWFVGATIGQRASVVFILAFVGTRTLSGDFLALNDKPHIDGSVLGGTMGNVQLLLHVSIAAVVTFAGVLQLLPAIRRRWPALHRWNGRVFMLTALIATLSGLYLTWIRSSQLNLESAISTTLNGVLILVFVALAWRNALRHDFATQRRHALRAYLLVNGVRFYASIWCSPAAAVGARSRGTVLRCGVPDRELSQLAAADRSARGLPVGQARHAAGREARRRHASRSALRRDTVLVRPENL